MHDPTWTTMGKTSLPEDSTRQSWQLGRFANTDMGAEFGQHSYRLTGTIPYRLTGTIPLDRLGPTEENWDEIHDIYFDVRLRGSARSVRKYLYSPGALKRRSVRDVVLDGTDVSHLVLPYFAAKTHRLAFRVENFAPDNLRFMQRLLWFVWILTPLRPIFCIWLIGEMPYKAQDNGFHFFRWIRTTHPKRRAYYVIDAHTPERANVEPFGNVLEHGSRKHIHYTVLATRGSPPFHAHDCVTATPRVRCSGGSAGTAAICPP